jgi:hypothetical protein
MRHPVIRRHIVYLLTTPYSTPRKDASKFLLVVWPLSAPTKGSKFLQADSMVITTSSTAHAPNLAVEWVALQLRIRQVPSSNLGPETNYSEALHGIPEILAGLYIKLGHGNFLPNPFQFVINNRPITRRYSVSY